MPKLKTLTERQAGLLAEALWEYHLVFDLTDGELEEVDYLLYQLEDPRRTGERH